MTQGRCHAIRFLLNVIQPLLPVDKTRQPTQRRIAVLAAKRKFTRLEALIIVTCRGLDNIVIGAVSLDHNAAQALPRLARPPA